MRQALRDSAFWHGRTCVQCGASQEEDFAEVECPECEGGQLVDSRALLALIERSEAEGDSE